LPLSIIDNPTLKINDRPIIPGSTIKGVLRTYLYRIINSLDDNSLKNFGLKKRDDDFDEKQFQEKENEKKLDLLDKIGSIDKLFGISGLAAPLIITDAEISNDNGEPLTVIKPHVKIDPNTDIASKSGPFYVEAIIPNKNKKFSFQMIFEEPMDDFYNDAKALFEHLKKIISPNPESGGGLELFIGDMKSRGYGLVRINLKEETSISISKLIK